MCMSMCWSKTKSFKMAQPQVVTASDVAAGVVPHFQDWLHCQHVAEYKVVIPSYNRPRLLCETTLQLLRKQGVPLGRVAVFVAPGTVAGQQDPEWARYLKELRDHDMLEVHLMPGAAGLEHQMTKAMEWVGSGYFITMSDTVREIHIKTAGRDCGKRKLRAMPAGMLPALFDHGRCMLAAGDFVAWSVNPSHNVFRMTANTISRKLGLLDGNLTGMILPSNWQELRVADGHGLIYDVEWSAKLWKHGYRFCRYMNVCADHTYRRPGGQATLFDNVQARRQLEDAALKRVANECPGLLSWKRNDRKSLKSMQYQFHTVGPSPLRLNKRRQPGTGRNCENFALRPMTSAERKRKQRTGSPLGAATKGGQPGNHNSSKPRLKT